MSSISLGLTKCKPGFRLQDIDTRTHANKPLQFLTFLGRHRIATISLCEPVHSIHGFSREFPLQDGTSDVRLDGLAVGRDHVRKDIEFCKSLDHD